MRQNYAHAGCMQLKHALSGASDIFYAFLYERNKTENEAEIKTCYFISSVQLLEILSSVIDSVEE